ncbi:MAG: hypothetical protein WC667_03705 [Sulfurimonas sp.]|jgi:hypothetical protein
MKSQQNNICTKDMPDLPKRSDYIYQEIESFKDYELTQCVAYEMAIRNNNVKNILDKIDYLTALKCKTSIHPNINKLNESITPEEKEKYLTLGLYHLNELTNELENDLINKYFIYPDGYKKKIKSNDNYLLIKKILNDTTGNQKFSYKSNQKEAIGFTIAQGIYTESKIFDISNITTNFKRQVYDSNQTSVFLNLSLPKQELIKYITHIKDTMDSSDKRIIKSPLELLGEELDKSEEPKSAKKLPRNYQEKKAAIVDAFFVYDIYKVLTPYYKIKKTEATEKKNKEVKKIRQSKEFDRDQKKFYIENINIDYRHDIDEWNKLALKNEIVSISGLSKDKIEIYSAYMTEYIDDLKYKELIIGTSSNP